MTQTPTVYGVGFVDGLQISIRGKHTKAYKVWQSMLERCYSQRYLEKKPTYVGCYVNVEWHSYRNFSSWYDKQLIKDDWQLDKDLIVEGNREYGPSFCSFVSPSINSLIRSRPCRDLPIGVYRNRYGRFATSIRYLGKLKHLGTYNTPNEAFNRYKTYKEQLVKLVAEKHKDDLHPKVYKYLVSYQVPEWDNQIN